MLSIGELACRAGVSRRMLRHWDDIGLLKPATVDPAAGYRWYMPSQIGRVQAVAALRAVGFGLDEISDLLDAELTADRLLELLRTREAELVAQVDDASIRLTEVRKRLRSIEKGRQTTMNTLQLTPLPALNLACVQTTVTDESEIAGVVGDLLCQLRQRLTASNVSNADVVLTYYGPPGDTPIEVSAGVEAERLIEIADLVPAHAASTDKGVTVSYDGGGVGDAWLMLDATLEPYQLRTTGVYRQLISAGGATHLQAPVEPLSTAC